jgi:hypothetical protein
VKEASVFSSSFTRGEGFSARKTLLVLLAAALLASTFAALFANPAEAKKRHHHHHKKKQQVVVNNIFNGGTPPLPVFDNLGQPVSLDLANPLGIEVTNPSATEPVVVDAIEVLGRQGKVLGEPIPLTNGPVSIEPGQTKTLDVTLPETLVNAKGLRLVDADGNTIMVQDTADPPVTSNDIPINVA